jgi:hypothetical protein
VFELQITYGQLAAAVVGRRQLARDGSAGEELSPAAKRAAKLEAKQRKVGGSNSAQAGTADALFGKVRAAGRANTEAVATMQN